MAFPKQKLIALCLSVIFITGCTSVKVIRNPDESDTGIRYYRPKPYLLVTPADPTGRLVNMKLEYLPDFNEEYSVHPRGKTSIALKDGWNLVGVNTKEAPKEEDKPPAKIEDIKLPGAVVSATNVPMGYYESVYGMAGNRKFLQGWRYIGMTLLGGGQPNVCRIPGHSPNCPSDTSGGTGGVPNGCISGPLYGLVFFNGVMTFRQLDEIANNQLCPMYVNPAPADPAAPATKVQGETPTQKPQIQGDTPPPAPRIQGDTPPTPSATPPAPGSASIYRPKVTPALVVLKPANSSKVNAPLPAAGTSASQLAASQATYSPITNKPANMPPLVSVDPIKATPAKKVVAGSPGLDQDPLLGTPPGLDQDLFRTGTSPRP